MKRFGEKLVKVVIIALVFGVVTGAGFYGTNYVLNKVGGNGTTQSAASSSIATDKNEIQKTAVSTATTVTDVSDIVKNVMPSAVAVTNMSVTQYRTFFGTGSYESQVAGSGILISQDNEHLYIATNNHVVHNAERLSITFVDEKSVPATIVGTDATTDLAVVSVKKSDVDKQTMKEIKVATLGDSDKALVGSSAIVIGNALGYGQSVTTGVISALSREVKLQDERGNIITNKLIQTDAAVNPGNSGGALLNMNGEVIGIVSAKYSDTDVEGMGYAIPITFASSILDSLVKGQSIEKQDAYLGIACSDISSLTLKKAGLSNGILVDSVNDGSSAKAAGIEEGDIIIALDSVAIRSVQEAQSIIGKYAANSSIKVTLAKKNNHYETEDVNVTLGAKKNET